MKVFASGSCRLLTTLRNTDDVTVIHNLYEPYFSGTNFVGKFHDTKSHIQFIRFIKGELELDDDIKKRFFTAYNEKWKDIRYFEPIETFYKKIQQLKSELDSCDVYIFEICSLKQYKYKGHYCQFEQTINNELHEYDITIQTKEELLLDLHILTSFFPNKKIIFQSHFRPNIIFNDVSKLVPKRELIYRTLLEFCSTVDNCYVYDPSIILCKDNTLFDGDTHFNQRGFDMNFSYLYNTYLKNRL
jgi:hypothetical protein